MRKLTADRVYPMTGEPIDNGLIVVDDEGVIKELTTSSAYANADQEKYDGILVPGFINAHCHLELSHMKEAIPSGTGLIEFITIVVTQRDADEKKKYAAMLAAEDEMIANGIVAVGDISNVTDSFPIKEENRLQYHTFIESFDLLQSDRAQNAFDESLAVYEQFSLPEGQKKTIVPHAPYSVSSELHRKIMENYEAGGVLSIHNQETPDENAFFENKTGDFIDFYKKFNLPIDEFQPTGNSSLQSTLEKISDVDQLLLIHNTFTSEEDIEAVKQADIDAYYVSCPRANLFIENRLPDYRTFVETNSKVCLGTDSLSSNWGLSIWEELKTVMRFNSWLEIDKVLKWSTINGAEALNLDEVKGSIEVGKRPGINHIDRVDFTGHWTEKGESITPVA